MSATSDGIDEILARHFPEIPGLREGQREAINRTVAGRNSICLMPTGGGKSLVYQVAGIHRGGTTLVISPLVALMSQQVGRLAERPGISAVSLSEYSGPKLYQLLRTFDFEGAPSFIFTSPERLANDGFVEFALRRNSEHIKLVVVDEAHCISQWGHTFRPSYKAIPRFLDRAFGSAGWPPVLCLTATLNPRDLDEIRSDLRVAADDTLRTPTMLRTNLTLSCEHLDDETAKRERLATLLRAHEGQKILVYVHRKSGEYGTRGLTAHLSGLGIACDYFDSERKDEDKVSVLERFENGGLKIVLATSAFGMGIDIADISMVIHYLLPESIEQYYQEVGRAGRNGEPAQGCLLFTDTNVRIRKQLIEGSVVSRAEIENLFSTKLVPRSGEKVRSIDPYQGFVEGDGELSTWFMLQQAGVITVLAKGMSKIDCFAAPARTQLPDEFARYQAVSRSGLTLGIARKLGIPIADVVGNLWQFYADGRLTLVSSPMLTHVFSAPEVLPSEVADALEADQQTKLQVRLAGFQALVHMVQGGGDPTTAVRAHLGLV